MDQRPTAFGSFTEDNMPLSLCLLAEKGGVGRTTTCVNLGSWFAARGLRTLLIDTDPQSSLSKFFLGTNALYDLPKGNTIAALFDDRYAPQLEDLVRETLFKNLFLAPSSSQLKDHNLPRPATLGDLRFALREFVLEAKSHYDMIIIDCPPDVGNLPTFSSLLAADYALTPIEPERFSVQSIAGVDAQLAAAQEINTELRFLGYFMSKRRTRLSLHKAIEDKLRGLQRERVFQTVVPMMVAYAEAQSQGEPINVYAPESREAEISGQLAEEVLRRINQATNARRAA